MSKKREEETIIPKELSTLHNFSGDIKRSVFAIALFSLAIIVFLSFFEKAGVFGDFLNQIISLAIGWMKFIFPVFLVIAGGVLLFRKETLFYVSKIVGLGVVFLSTSGFLHWFFASEKMILVAKNGQGGGYTGYFLAHFFNKYFGEGGGLVVILTIFFTGLIITFNFSVIQIFHNIKNILSEKKSGKDNQKDNQNEKEEETPLERRETKENETEEKKEKKEEKKTEEIEVEKNIGRMEFVNGRDQYISSQIDMESESIFSHNLERKNFSEDELLNPSVAFERKKFSKKRKWVFPPPDLLEKSSQKAKAGDVEAEFSIIEKTLKNFGIEVERGEPLVGPSVTQYSFRPAVGVKIAKILALQNDLALALAARSIRIEAPIPGKSFIGVEVPNKIPADVRLRDIIDEREFKKRESDLTLAIGRDVSGGCFLKDLAQMPHLLIAGSTGTGKSVSINAIITSLLYQNSPENLKFLMVDPKRVELSLYKGIPHLLTDVIVDNDKVINALNWAVGEMGERYKLLQETGSRDIESYKRKMKEEKSMAIGERKEWKNLPYIVIIIDELADLMGSHGREVEGAIVRIAQMARAVGIHLILSTQRPSVKVITGLIKANITTRMAFQVATQIDSRTIIDMGGAEKLLGKGDMLYSSSASPKPKRVQGVFISESEVKRVVKFIKENNPVAKVDLEKYPEDISENEKNSYESEKDILGFNKLEASDEDGYILEEAKKEIIMAKKVSASFLQRRLKIGYNRASRILDILEEKGLVGPSNGAKPREIYFDREETGEKEKIEYEDSLEDQEKRDKWQI
ncbi:MAG: hypothetical protein COZ85_03775 [Candidatus Moranbacteria bacterium CG_4_8_14_3_um_filter_34_16]|nr:MAG: hypothetical protein COT31_03525 [Candidatus Moranbacteria bacterium CG08_land_8_20_14_0_20_34_16]PIW94704.1 MAG: hypothetical protein COZ85_03775 [Candidatus Moranbacteria bacterium CG_4_8_14_3_um_filter_34_16]PJA89173.1 MAG: hypothetical protein CO138_01870 [Candidatus Moranbacteria bacterium CG_4_9_14_3_um_filter_33_15]